MVILHERNEVKFGFIEEKSKTFPVRLLCRVMKVGKSAFYCWRKRPKQTISAEDLHLNARMKKLFTNSRESLGSREMTKKLNEEGINIGRGKTRVV